ncbi:MAG: methylmalonyl-CoA mutase [Hyphobacterium sp.]|nr:MAG: methylmalonyl-CoA mutase [Hyphobacterium sp.]
MRETLHDLIKDFPVQTENTWRVLAENSLNGADFEDALLRKTTDGIARGPAFFDRPTEARFPRIRNASDLPWQIRQVFTESTPEDANQAILRDLMGGVSQIGLQIDQGGNHGLAAEGRTGWATAFKSVDLAIAPAYLEPGHNIDARRFAEWMQDSGAKSGGLGLRPDHPDLVEIRQEFPGFSAATVDARCIHETGGTEVQELGYAAAGFAEVIGRLVEGNADRSKLENATEVILAADADIHLSIAKLRAARLLLQAILKAYGIETNPVIRAVTSARMMTAQDPWTNMVRTSAAGFAAAAGGADIITILPATEALGRPDPLARRAARNTQIVLQEEAHAGLVKDPSAGSFLHETLTQELAIKAWTSFQSIEGNGGFAQLGENRDYLNAVNAARVSLERSYATQARVLFGVNKFAAPSLREMRYLKGSSPPTSDPRFPAICLESAVHSAGAS